MKRILEVLVQRQSKLTPAEMGKELELLFSWRYGGKKTASASLKQLRKKHPKQADFEKAIQRETNYSLFEKIAQLFKNDNSLPDFIELVQKLKTGEITLEASEEERKIFSIMYANASRYFEKQTYFDTTLAETITFTLKEIRDEVGVNQRTFSKWLQFYFDKKYNGRRTVNLNEYIEIFKVLLLKEEEKQFKFALDSEAYYQRLNDGLVFRKDRLIRLTDTDYKTLASNARRIVDTYKEMDLFPYRLAQQILTHISS